MNYLTMKHASTPAHSHIHIIAVSLEVVMVIVSNKCYEKICNWSLLDIAQGICELFKFWTKKISNFGGCYN